MNLGRNLIMWLIMVWAIGIPAAATVTGSGAAGGADEAGNLVERNLEELTEQEFLQRIEDLLK